MAAPRNDNVKDKILDAATGLLNTQTFADISLAEIAAAAGVSKGTLYYHYKNKTDKMCIRDRASGAMPISLASMASAVPNSLTNHDSSHRPR